MIDYACWCTKTAGSVGGHRSDLEPCGPQAGNTGGNILNLWLSIYVFTVVDSLEKQHCGHFPLSDAYMIQTNYLSVRSNTLARSTRFYNTALFHDGNRSSFRNVAYNHLYLSLSSPYHVFTIHLNFFGGVHLFMHKKSVFVCFFFRLVLQW
jgi:hypothetical protein